MSDSRKQELMRTLKFLVFSISAGVIQILSFTLMNEFLGGWWGYWPSYLISLVLSVLWNFTFNRRFTFKSASNVPIAMLKVFAFYAVFTPLSTLLGDYLVKTVGWNEYLVTVMNMVINLILEFLYQRFFVFKTTMDTNDLAAKKTKE